MLELILTTQLLQAPVTQPPAQELLNERSFAAALVDLEASPRVRVHTVARSHRGRPIVLIIVGIPDAMAQLDSLRSRAVALSGPSVVHKSLSSIRIREKNLAELTTGAFLPVLFAGASWGNEASQVEGLLRAAKTLAFDDTEEVHSALKSAIALIMPLLNPDGRELALEEWKETPLSNGAPGAGNSYGFMLNRDFLHGTQPEARSVIETVMRWRPVAVIDQHEDMFNLGARLPEVCFVEPFVPGFDVEEHPLTREATMTLGNAIAQRWQELGFRTLFNIEGDNRFAPLPERGEGINPVASSAGRLNLMCTLHGIPSFITESARTPGSQSWEDRVQQKASSVLATLTEVSSDPLRYARAVYERRVSETIEGRERFVVIPQEGQPRDGLDELLRVLRIHHAAVFQVAQPYSAFVIPLAQPEGRLVRHLILGERSKLNELPPALGVRIVPSETLSESDRQAFLDADLAPAILSFPQSVSMEESAFAARPTVRSTALVNRLLSTGAAAVYQAGNRYHFEGSGTTIGWQASQLGVPLVPAQKEEAPPRSLRLPRAAIYMGQGVSKAEWGETGWALEQGAFPYRLIDDNGLCRSGALNTVDVLIVPNGSAAEIVYGWDPEARTRRSPWQAAEAPHGIGRDGLEVIRSFIRRGGTYVGLGAGGALLAGTDYLAVTEAEMIPAAVGLGQVRMRPAQRDSPLLFGYPGDDLLPAFFFAPPGSNDRGHAFRANGSAVASFSGAHEFPDERSFMSTHVLRARSGNAAIVHERYGRGHVVLFGIAPTFRGQWWSTFRLLYNALYLATESEKSD